MHYWLVIVFFLSFVQASEAACVTLNRDAWTTAQKQLTKAIAYRLVFEAGEDIVPTAQGETLCFANSTVNLPTVVNETTILARYATDEAANQAALAAEQARQAGFASEVTSNDLCDAELADITTRIETVVGNLQTQLDAAGTVAQVKAHLRDTLYPALGTALRKVARCLRARSH